MNEAIKIVLEHLLDDCEKVIVTPITASGKEYIVIFKEMVGCLFFFMHKDSHHLVCSINEINEIHLSNGEIINVQELIWKHR